MSKQSAPRISNRARNKRQGTETLYRKLIAEGFTDEHIRAAHTDDIRNRSYGLVIMDQPGEADPIIGVGYGGDYRSEEESGQGAISTSLATEKSAQTCISYPIKKVTAFSIASNRREQWRDFHEEMNEVVKAAMSRRRRGQERTGEFHYGNVLVMLVENDDKLTLAVLNHLFGDAASNGSLRYGSTRNPFSRAAVFYDERDISAAEMDEIRAVEKFHDDAMKDVSDVRDRLMACGRRRGLRNGSVYFVGNPRNNDERGVVYWLNGSFTDDKYQNYGWYSKSELEDIAERMGA